MPSEDPTFVEAARRTQLVRTATAVIADHGYAHASLARISSAAGVSVGVIGYHFGNRAGLIRAVLADAVGRATAAIAPEVTRQPSAGTALRALIEANIGFLADHPHDLRALTEIIRNGSDVGVTYDAQADVAVQDVQRVLDWGHHTGEFRPFDTRVMALAVRASIDTLVSYPPGVLDLALAARELADAFEGATTAVPAPTAGPRHRGPDAATGPTTGVTS
ncbi:MAG: TetR/AcrR family transcriptional regulator [Lapillicoccus sp.]